LRQTINGEIIPDDRVIVLIENTWIENEIDLSHELILQDIEKIPEDLEDLEDDLSDTEGKNDENILTDDDDDNTNGRGILNYNVDELLNEYVNE
jgi:hypothetical protein